MKTPSEALSSALITADVNADDIHQILMTHNQQEGLWEVAIQTIVGKDLDPGFIRVVVGNGGARLIELR